jgi:predicted GNAT family N-acyltransferase
MLPPREYTVRTENDTAVTTSYTLRGLNDDEIEAWTEFCAQTFSYKKPAPPPADYFARHYYNDPQRDASLIRVAVFTPKNEIVASCRVFLRSISSASSPSSAMTALPVGGIGEVCTAEAHRRRGLSAELLQDAVACMKAMNLRISILHSAPSFFPVYQNAGYVCSTSHWSVATVNKKTLETGVDHGNVRAASFPNDTEQLMSIHQLYSEQRFAGCIQRSKEYWEQYLAKELEGSLWVLVQDNDSADAPAIMGWLSLRQRCDHYQVREFGCRNVETIGPIFRRLLAFVLNESIEMTPPGPTFSLHLPTAMLHEIQASTSNESDVCLLNIVADDDLGWMYKVLDDSSDNTIAGIASGFPHLIWPSDSF